MELHYFGALEKIFLKIFCFSSHHYSAKKTKKSHFNECIKISFYKYLYFILYLNNIILIFLLLIKNNLIILFTSNEKMLELILKATVLFLHHFNDLGDIVDALMAYWEGSRDSRVRVLILIVVSLKPAVFGHIVVD